MTRAPTEMETRVAKALSDASYNAKDGRGSRQGDLEQRGIDLQLARAAIRAMRTPTTEMLREAGLGATSSTEDIAYMWEAMIDAASPGDE